MSLGFAGVEETAVGAAIVKDEYDRIVDGEKQDVVISTCCHTVNLLVQKHFPDVIPYLAKVVSPMQAHCTKLKKSIRELKQYLYVRAYQKGRGRGVSRHG